MTASLRRNVAVLVATAGVCVARVPKASPAGAALPAEHRAAGEDDAPIDAGDKRERPDYDGRGEDPTTAGDVAIWVPRVVVSPLYLVTEYAIRRPLGALATWVEKEGVVEAARDLFTFGPSDNIAVVPTGLFDFGFRPSFGAFALWDDFVTKGNDLRFRGAYGFDGLDWWTFVLADRVRIRHDQDFSVRGSYRRRSDFVFHGLGPRSGGEESRYRAQVVEGGFRYEADITRCRLADILRPATRCRTSGIDTYAFVRHASFEPDKASGGEPTVAHEVARGRFLLPPGMADGYTTFHQGVRLILDSRPRRYTHVSARGEPLEERIEASDHVPPPGTGVKLALRAEHAGGLEDSRATGPGGGRRLHWVRYGATAGGFLDLNGQQRVLGLSLIVDFADPFEHAPEIPFTEQVSLGGARPLRGFLEGRLIDRSSSAARLEYRYPIWVWLDGAAHYSVGNVFGKHLEGLETGLLRQSFGLGFRTTNSRDNTFEVLVAFGTKTFDDGGGIDNVRFVVGTASGF